MSTQDKLEKVLRDMHVMVSRGQPVDMTGEKIVIEKRAMYEQLKMLNACMSELMDEYELTKASRDAAEREARKRGDSIIYNANKKAEDVYAAAVLYTDEALFRTQQLIKQSSESLRGIMTATENELMQQRATIQENQSELKSQLQDMVDTRKYLNIIDDRNKELEKAKQEKENDGKGVHTVERHKSYYGGQQPEIKVNPDYFKKTGTEYKPYEDEEDYDRLPLPSRETNDVQHRIMQTSDILQKVLQPRNMDDMSMPKEQEEHLGHAGGFLKKFIHSDDDDSKKESDDSDILNVDLLDDVDAGHDVMPAGITKDSGQGNGITEISIQSKLEEEADLLKNELKSDSEPEKKAIMSEPVMDVKNTRPNKLQNKKSQPVGNPGSTKNIPPVQTRVQPDLPGGLKRSATGQTRVPGATSATGRRPSVTGQQRVPGAVTAGTPKRTATGQTRVPGAVTSAGMKPPVTSQPVVQSTMDTVDSIMDLSQDDDQPDVPKRVVQASEILEKILQTRKNQYPNESQGNDQQAGMPQGSMQPAHSGGLPAATPGIYTGQRPSNMHPGNLTKGLGQRPDHRKDYSGKDIKGKNTGKNNKDGQKADPTKKRESPEVKVNLNAEYFKWVQNREK